VQLPAWIQKGGKAGGIGRLVQQWTDSCEQLAQESVWPIHYYEVMATVESHKFLMWCHNAREIFLCQFQERLLVMGPQRRKLVHRR
jgi:hypothetical protein